MDRTMTYKGYQLAAKSLRLAAPIRWSVAVTIMKPQPNGSLKIASFGTGDTFHTEDEAITASLAFGRQIVDGHYSELSEELP